MSLDTKETGLILGSVVLVKSACFSFLETGKIVDEWTRKDANLNAGKYPFPALSNGDLTR